MQTFEHSKKQHTTYTLQRVFFEHAQILNLSYSLAFQWNKNCKRLCFFMRILEIQYLNYKPGWIDFFPRIGF